MLKDRIDVFWSPRHHLPLLAPIPTVVTIHDLVWCSAPGSMRSSGYLLDRLLMPASLKKADAIIAVSRSTRSDIVKYYPEVSERVSVILEAPFVAASAIRPSISEVPEILFVGTFEPRKNLERLIKAFATVCKSVDIPHRLILAGRTGWKVDVRELIRQLGVNDRVSVVTPESDDELATYYQRCQFLAMPSLYEGFGLPIVEALSFGKPVITSSVSAMPEVAGDAGLLVDPYSVADIAAALTRMATDHPLRDVLASRARKQAAQFSWDATAHQTLKVLHRVAAKGRVVHE